MNEVQVVVFLEVVVVYFLVGIDFVDVFVECCCVGDGELFECFGY